MCGTRSISLSGYWRATGYFFHPPKYESFHSFRGSAWISSSYSAPVTDTPKHRRTVLISEHYCFRAPRHSCHMKPISRSKHSESGFFPSQISGSTARMSFAIVASRLERSYGFQPPFSSALCHTGRKSATLRDWPESRAAQYPTGARALPVPFDFR